MSITLEDLTGLNRTEVHDLPMVDSQGTAERLLADRSRPLALAGMRHSQGGHAMLAGGSVLQTAMLNETIEVHRDGTVTVDAGVTWTELHRVLAPEGLCPKVHQSSPHFTVGGSISVNCHGRDPHAGPISTTLRSLTVLCGDGTVRTTVPGEDLFRAVVGGYGSCGMILQATLDLMENQVLKQTAEKLGGAAPLAMLNTKLLKLADEPANEQRTQLSYAWLNCEQRSFWGDVLMVSYTPTKDAASKLLKEEAWGQTEVLRAAWAAARASSVDRRYVWDLLCKDFLESKAPEYRMNWMRAAVNFTGHHDARHSDLLLEYFLPLDNALPVYLGELASLLRKRLNILSTTVRLVRQDTAAPYLDYCAKGPMVCVALDATVTVDPAAKGGPAPLPSVRAAVNAATKRVLEMGGRYYLPYHGFAGTDLFQRAYAPLLAEQRAAIQKYNPDRRYWNSFLAKYLA